MSTKIVGKKHYKQYQLKQVLGTGSFGKVYYSPPYAIKQMNFQGMAPFIVSALKNEIIILNKINHVNVVRLVDHFYQGTCVYLVLEYCEQDLAKYLKKNKCNEKMALAIFRQLLTGFRELVSQGIIHRDLKPANVLVNSKGEFKLADFGFAKFVDHYDSKLLYSIVGTPLYMSPQILGKTEYTTKSDIWSLGYILYEMITGMYPWTGNSESDLCKNIMTRPLNIPNYVSAYSRDLLVRMLKVNEKERIGWEELFAIGLNGANMSPEKPRPQTSREQNINLMDNKENGRSPSRRKVFPQNPDEKGKSNKKSDPQGRQPLIALEKQKQREKESNKTLNISEQLIRELFLAEMERILGEQECKKIAGKTYNGMAGSEKDQFERVLGNFNQEFKKAVRTIFKGGFK